MLIESRALVTKTCVRFSKQQNCSLSASVVRLVIWENAEFFTYVNVDLKRAFNDYLTQGHLHYAVDRGRRLGRLWSVSQRRTFLLEGTILCRWVGSITFLNGPDPASFLFFLFFSRDKYCTNFTLNYKSVDGLLGTQIWGDRMVGADESTELWRHPGWIDNFVVLDSTNL